MGKCRAGQPKAFSRNGTHGIDYTVGVSEPVVESQERRKKGRTPPSRTRIGSEPHSSRMARSSWRNHGCVKSPSHQSAVCSTVTYRSAIIVNCSEGMPGRTLIELAEQSASNDAWRCWTSDAHTASSDWSGTIRSETCAVTDAGMTVGSCRHFSRAEKGNKETKKRRNVLLGPDPRTLWIVSEGSRHRAESDEADCWVTDSRRRKSTASSSSCGRTLSSESYQMIRDQGDEQLCEKGVENGQKPGTRTLRLRSVSSARTWTLENHICYCLSRLGGQNERTYLAWARAMRRRQRRNGWPE